MTEQEKAELLELAEELREFTAMKYIGDCKCGKCQLVSKAFIDMLYIALRRASAPDREPVAWQYRHLGNEDWHMLKYGADPTDFLKQWPSIKYDVRPLYASLPSERRETP